MKKRRGKLIANGGTIGNRYAVKSGVEARREVRSGSK